MLDLHQTQVCIPLNHKHSISVPSSIFESQTFISLIEPQTCHVFQVTLIINIRRFEITDGDGNVALKILGPWCTYSCAGDVEFKVVETLVDVLPF